MEPTPWDPEGATAVLDVDGRLADGGAPAGLDLRAYYKHLVAARCLDLRLSRTALPMYAPSAGEEAPLVATALIAGEDDWIYPGTRDAAIAFARGMSADELARQVLGRDASSGGPALPGRVASAALRIATTTDALGMQLALAAGQAHGQKLTGDRGITFALCGEGVTTTGVFHEVIALAAQCDLPLVIVCRSQVWPSGAPAEAGVLGDSVAERARACGLWDRRVDGGDPLATWSAIAAAAARARDRRGPSLVEVVVTQLLHDPPAHRDPIERLRRHLDGQGAWTSTFQDVAEAEVRGRLERAFAVLERGGGEA
jgi:TPP-dependent pyruvate/acetoin dehydrogenase alpha subunit